VVSSPTCRLLSPLLFVLLNEDSQRQLIQAVRRKEGKYSHRMEQLAGTLQTKKKNKKTGIERNFLICQLN
jgi:hypothetical protein